MINQAIANKQTDSATHLKSVVEQCLAVLGEDKDSPAEAHTRRLRCGWLPLHIDPVNLQKRALSEAAKALATLWKISETRCVRPQSLRVSRSTS
jgi:hypothetical protein